MFEKNMKLAYLLDFYIDILDKHSQDIMRAYYEDDLSLAEIANDIGISRQGIRHIIKKCEEEILSLEAVLRLGEKHSDNERAIEKLKLLTDNPSINDSDMTVIKEVIEILEKGV